MSFWANKKVVVTGGAGFLGRYVVANLKKTGASEVFVPRSSDFDLREREAARRLMKQIEPDLVIHLAARVGGIGANKRNPGLFFYENAIMGIELMEAARRAGVQKFISVGTVCSYPRLTPVPFKEQDLWNGYPDEDGAPYGMAKKMLLVQSHAYRQEYGFNSVCLIPVNLYGPGDNFDEATSHVMPALVRRFLEAQERGLSEVVIWGTGEASREFLHVIDAASGIVLASEGYNSSDPINLGSGREIRMRDLAECIRTAVGFTGKITWDPSRPEGQPRRQLDTARAFSEIGFKSQIRLEEGLSEMVDWYRNERVKIKA